MQVTNNIYCGTNFQKTCSAPKSTNHLSFNGNRAIDIRNEISESRGQFFKSVIAQIKRVINNLNPISDVHISRRGDVVSKNNLLVNSRGSHRENLIENCGDLLDFSR